jgi:hypothetical protein
MVIGVCPSSRLATRVAIIAREKLLLCCETEQEALQLSGYFIEVGEKVVSRLRTFLSKNQLNEFPHQTLYFSHTECRI